MPRLEHMGPERWTGDQKVVEKTGFKGEGLHTEPPQLQKKDVGSHGGKREEKERGKEKGKDMKRKGKVSVMGWRAKYK